ncbi:FecR domain-containing protein [Limibacter armeniacum]|uniref:FecR family protein n=1 Tax=Limibacter armeniacum TaxID=466084 RepID=UPI002FE54255
MMKVEEAFRKLLRRAGQGTASTEEYQQLDKLVQKKLVESNKLSAEEISNSRERVLGRININEGKKRKQIILYWASYGTVAAVIILLFGIGFYQFDQNQNLPSTTPLARVEIQTVSGDRQTIVLPDGTEVVLNSNSSLSYPIVFEENLRSVTLRGEAYFKVKRNTKKPFVVHSADVVTTVLGTSFNIREATDEVAVTVTSGKVKVNPVADESNAVYLERNDQAIYKANTGNIVLNSAEADLYADWSKEILHFNNVPLSEAIPELEKWYGVNITVKSANLFSRSLQGSYQDKTLKYVMDDIKFIFDLKVNYLNDSTIQIEEIAQ